MLRHPRQAQAGSGYNPSPDALRVPNFPFVLVSYLRLIRLPFFSRDNTFALNTITLTSLRTTVAPYVQSAEALPIYNNRDAAERRGRYFRALAIYVLSGVLEVERAMSLNAIEILFNAEGVAIAGYNSVACLEYFETFCSAYFDPMVCFHRNTGILRPE